MSDQLPRLAKISDVVAYFKGKPAETACILTGGPSATDNVRVQLKRKGFGCSVVKLEDGTRRVVLQRLTPHVKKSHADWERIHSRSDDPSRTLEDNDPLTFGNSADGLKVGDSIRVVGNRKNLQRDVAARGWTASMIKDGNHWIVTRTS